MNNFGKTRNSTILPNCKEIFILLSFLSSMMAQGSIFDSGVYVEFVDYQCRNVTEKVKVDSIRVRYKNLIPDCIWHPACRTTQEDGKTINVNNKYIYKISAPRTRPYETDIRIDKRVNVFNRPLSFMREHEYGGDSPELEEEREKVSRKNPIIIYTNLGSRIARKTGQHLNSYYFGYDRGIRRTVSSPDNFVANDGSEGGGGRDFLYSFQLSENTSEDILGDWIFTIAVKDGGLKVVEGSPENYTENLPLDGYVDQIQFSIDEAVYQNQRIRKGFYFHADHKQRWGIFVVELFFNTYFKERLYEARPIVSIYYDFIEKLGDSPVSSSDEYLPIYHPVLPKFTCGGVLPATPDGFFSRIPDSFVKDKDWKAAQEKILGDYAKTKTNWQQENQEHIKKDQEALQEFLNARCPYPDRIYFRQKWKNPELNLKLVNRLIADEDAGCQREPAGKMVDMLRYSNYDETLTQTLYDFVITRKQFDYKTESLVRELMRQGRLRSEQQLTLYKKRTNPNRPNGPNYLAHSNNYSPELLHYRAKELLFDYPYKRDNYKHENYLWYLVNSYHISDETLKLLTKSKYYRVSNKARERLYRRDGWWCQYKDMLPRPYELRWGGYIGKPC